MRRSVDPRWQLNTCPHSLSPDNYIIGCHWSPVHGSHALLHPPRHPVCLLNLCDRNESSSPNTSVTYQVLGFDRNCAVPASHLLLSHFYWAPLLLLLIFSCCWRTGENLPLLGVGSSLHSFVCLFVFWSFFWCQEWDVFSAFMTAVPEVSLVSLLASVLYLLWFWYLGVKILSEVTWTFKKVYFNFLGVNCVYFLCRLKSDTGVHSHWALQFCCFFGLLVGDRSLVLQSKIQRLSSEMENSSWRHIISSDVILFLSVSFPRPQTTSLVSTYLNEVYAPWMAAPELWGVCLPWCRHIYKIYFHLVCWTALWPHLATKGRKKRTFGVQSCF